MFGGLNKIFDRNFVVGFAMPAVALLFLSHGMLSLFDMLPPFLKLDGTEPFKDTTVLAIASLLVAFTLMILNWNILRLAEGYWRFDFGHRILDLGSKWNRYYVKLWRDLRSRIEVLTLERDDCNRRGVPFQNRWLRNRLSEDFAQRYPNREDLVLPTKLGNAIRAFEDYPRVMYGFESITGWSRLNTVIPKDYRKLLDEARADLNFWINLLFADLLLLSGYVLLAIVKRSTPFVWLIVPSLALLPFYISAQATRAAIAWGDWVKSAFDIYLPELRKKLGSTRAMTHDEEREFWTGFSQAITYRKPEPLINIARFRDDFEESAPPTPVIPMGEDQP